MKIRRLTENSWIARILGGLAAAVIRYQPLFVYPQLLLFVLCIVYTWFNLKLDFSRDNLVGANKKYHQNFRNFKKEFPTQDDLVVVVQSENTEKNRQFVERLGVKLEAETNMFRDVFYKGDPKMLGSKALLFFPENDLKELRKALQDYQPFLQQFTHATNLQSLFEMVNTQFRTAREEKNAENDAMIKAMPALERIVRQALDRLRTPATPPAPRITASVDAGSSSES